MAENLFRNRTQGTECWIHGSEGREEPVKEERLWLAYTGYEADRDWRWEIDHGISGYHDGSVQRFFFVTDNHLLESDFSQSEIRCLYDGTSLYDETSDGIRLLTVNDQGIFLGGHEDKGEMEKSVIILWLTLEGKLKKKILLKGNIVQLYICGNLIFYRRAVYLGEGKLCTDDMRWRCSAFWMDMNEGTENVIFLARDERARKEKPYEEGNNVRGQAVGWLVGNDKGAVFKLSTWNYYVDDDYDGSYQVDGDGWYYYDFEKLYCLSHCRRVPILMYEKPQEYIEQCQMYSQENIVSWHRNIVAFNMEKNLMWVSRNRNGHTCWVPINISAGREKQTRTDLPVWNIPNDVSLGIEFFFDGERLYYFDRCLKSLNADGKVEEWPIHCPSQISDGKILRFGDYVVVYGSDMYHYDECFVCSASHSFQGILAERVFAFGWDDPKIREKVRRVIEAFDNACGESGNDQRYENEWEAAAIENEVRHEEKADRGRRAAENSRQPDRNEVPASQRDYWAGFRAYAVKKRLNAKLKFPEAADHNWYAIRLGSATFRIECSVNARRGTLRAAFFVKNDQDVYARLARYETTVESELEMLGEIVWDGESQAANVSVITSREGKNTMIQYEWFCQAVEKLYEVCSNTLSL